MSFMVSKNDVRVAKNSIDLFLEVVEVEASCAAADLEAAETSLLVFLDFFFGFRGDGLPPISTCTSLGINPGENNRLGVVILRKYED